MTPQKNIKISSETYTYTEIANIILVLKITKGKNGCLYSGHNVETYSREEKIETEIVLYQKNQSEQEDPMAK